jgi:hypothetical protein
MVSVLTKSSLTPARRRLVERLQQLNFGRVEGLLVRGGEPVFGPATRVVREIKFGGENAPRPERGLGDFLVKAQVAELLRCLSEIGDGVIDVLEVKHGLPFRLILAEAPDHAA